MIMKDFKNNILSTEQALFVLKNMKSEMLHLINICKEDFHSKEANTVSNELRETLNTDSTLKNINIDFVTRVDSMIFRSWLVNYKNRGYILTDIGNGHFNYVCTAEEALIGIHYHKFQSEY